MLSNVSSSASKTLLITLQYSFDRLGAQKGDVKDAIKNVLLTLCESDANQRLSKIEQKRFLLLREKLLKYHPFSTFVLLEKKKL